MLNTDWDFISCEVLFLGICRGKSKSFEVTIWASSQDGQARNLRVFLARLTTSATLAVNPLLEATPPLLEHTVLKPKAHITHCFGTNSFEERKLVRGGTQSGQVFYN